MAKTAKAKKVVYPVTFGSWLKTKARARGDVAEVLATLKAARGITEKTDINRARKSFGNVAGFDELARRYEGFCARSARASA